MRYQRVGWDHARENDPVVIYRELDDEAWEVRKVEVFRDGSLGFASADEEFGSTGLSETVIPSLEEIRRDPAFTAVAITPEEFDAVWRARHGAP